VINYNFRAYLEENKNLGDQAQGPNLNLFRRHLGYTESFELFIGQQAHA
jgi:hypothetical protein